MSETLVAPSLCTRRAVISPPEIEFRPGAISGEMLLDRFAVPCAYDKFMAGKIDEGVWKHLVAIALGEPEQLHIIRGLLSDLFPRLVSGLYEHRGPNGDSPAWSYKNVLAYLLEHEGHADECASKCLTIGSGGYLFAGTERSLITGDSREMFWAIVDKERYCRLFDLYQIRPESGSKVLAHKSVIVAELTPKLVSN